MDNKSLVGLRVLNKKTNRYGVIKGVTENTISVDIHGNVIEYAFPDCFSTILELEQQNLQDEMEQIGTEQKFEDIIREFQFAINNEITYLKYTGGKNYNAIDGEKIGNSNENIYAFDTDSELHFQDGTPIKIHTHIDRINGQILNCENYTLIIKTMRPLPNLHSINFTVEQWILLEAIINRLSEINFSENTIAYEVACKGKEQIEKNRKIVCGQSFAISKGTTEPITFVWGPPGTGKTETLATIALEHLSQGKRVLMLSYSNVSVDGALLRVAGKSDFPEGEIIRYGYPRMKDLLENDSLTSYRYVLKSNPELEEKYNALIKKRATLGRKDKRRVEINSKINKIRESLFSKEKELIYKAGFVATTVSKATIDKSIYEQKFDVVIFDEASMAYIPQIIFASSLAKKHFICLGDFRQLASIVQNKDNHKLMKDIFEYTGITNAVDSGYNHKWLVMLNIQYRMHHEIADFISENMYSSLLKTADIIYEKRKEIASCAPMENEAISMLDLSGMYSVCKRTGDNSRINLLSALVDIKIAETYVDKYDVAIITPYNAQSRLVHAMIRDLQESDERYSNISCATVHQFQGSEKPIIIYDAVDCFRQKYPGTLLTSTKNDTANRLFNVAMTRAKGKFILVANSMYFKMKNISSNLVFSKCLKYIENYDLKLCGKRVEKYLYENNKGKVLSDDKSNTFPMYLDDIFKAKKSIVINLPGAIDDELVDELVVALDKKKKDGVSISIKYDDNLVFPYLSKYDMETSRVTTPVTVIDQNIIWFVQPLFSDDFIAGGSSLETTLFPCFRFRGKYTARIIKTFLEL